ncbi:electron transport complex subunit RsxC [Shewanella sp. WXL01]|uniref:electron transport complex subunit RsxC n=1 Tax=Shewanella sp. WXL01 TaxID=2709721 RepID=UPI0014382776|nr:electron transport complex subunit RsxC [Shewanella sp. WXL01]
MLTLLEQLDKGTLWHSPGGIHPPELKQSSNTAPIARLSLAPEYIVPIPQVGDLAVLTAQKGDHVLKGQMLTQGKGFSYLPVHAPTSGVVKAIEPRVSNHASGLPVLSLVIEPDGEDTWAKLTPAKLDELSNQAIIDKIKDAGIAGMGGAAFPSHIKLNPASEIDLVIINGVECEPFITSDDRLMREHATEIISGVEVINKLLTPKRIVIAIEDNKPEAIQAMEQAVAQCPIAKGLMRVTVIPTKYPSGGEKQLIQIITGQEVPSGAIPAQLGIVVHNVGTAFAIQDAVLNGKPLIERVVTLTGDQVAHQGNYWLPIGTPIKHALQQCQFSAQTQQKLIIGGPMMGYAISELQVPVLKGTNCVLAPSNNQIAEDSPEQACIRCGECAVACPALLLPQQLFWHSKAEEYDKAASFNLQDCIECGCCSYVCPSDIPLVEYYRIAKSALRNAAEEKRQAEAAKHRFEARLKRLEDEKLAREAKAKAAADKRKKAMSGSDKDAVAEAMARIAAKKKAAEQSAQSASETGTPETNTSANNNKSAAVSAAIARAKAKKAKQAQQASGTSETSQNAESNAQTDPTAESKQDRVAAAVARAKAKKAQQAKEADKASDQQTEAASPSVSGELDPQKARVAAAIARAKAKKAAQQAAKANSGQAQAGQSQANSAPTAHADAPSDEQSTDTSVTDSNATDNQSAQDSKKARIAAAVAKAKAKKAAQNSAESTDSKQATETITEKTSTDAELAANNDGQDDKKARIAAAVAKAKAKKMAQQAPSASELDDSQAEDSASEADTQAKQDTVADAPSSGPVESAAEQKQARIAAAVAKAKAKKAAKEAEQSDVPATSEASKQNQHDDEAQRSDTQAQAVTPTSAPLTAEEQKKARIAAAVAKAKAKKLAKQQEE